jgi:glycogen debranching enzyme
MNGLGGTGLWDEEDGFYYDQVHTDSHHLPIRLRSLVGLIPLFACELLEEAVIERLPGFARRMRWFLEHRADLTRDITCMECSPNGSRRYRLLAIPTRDRLLRVLRYLLDENEFLSPFGIRSLSRAYRDRPFEFALAGSTYSVRYVAGESDSALFGGNSNWRGPVWFPVNYLLVEALERYHHFYGDALKVECPTGSGRMATLQEVSQEISRRLVALFLPDPAGRRPCHGEDRRFAEDPHWRELALFYEYFHGEDGRGCGASHQTGWTALVTRCLEDLARGRTAR